MVEIVGLGPVGKGLEKGLDSPKPVEAFLILHEAQHGSTDVEKNQNGLVWLPADVNRDNNLFTIINNVIQLVD